MRGSRFTKYLRTGVSRLLVLVLLASAVLLGSAAQAMAAMRMKAMFRRSRRALRARAERLE